MDRNEIEVKLLAIVNILNGVTVSGEDNMARLVTAIRELKNVSNALHKDAEIHEDIHG